MREAAKGSARPMRLQRPRPRSGEGGLRERRKVVSVCNRGAERSNARRERQRIAALLAAPAKRQRVRK